MNNDIPSDVVGGTIIAVNAERRREYPSMLIPSSYVVRLDDGREVTAIDDIVPEESSCCRLFRIRFGETKVKVDLGSVFEPTRIVEMDGVENL